MQKAVNYLRREIYQIIFCFISTKQEHTSVGRKYNNKKSVHTLAEVILNESTRVRPTDPGS